MKKSAWVVILCFLSILSPSKSSAEAFSQAEAKNAVSETNTHAFFSMKSYNTAFHPDTDRYGVKMQLIADCWQSDCSNMCENSNGVDNCMNNGGSQVKCTADYTNCVSSCMNKCKE
ncbi:MULTISPECIES: hypothetical protein [Klebsiella pneumoniae complex]|uniref:hypothetical protein n=1 Tax=Klebsiella pneumoniae complex TaxID=3390273 RepID=UPI00103415A7|nr:MULTISPECIES: hypothetical protein [Klebsiella]MBC5532099.1 hypothetical protein [Klebsiella variicola]MDP0789964.1 hypothetical protein [Klebsiella pneumoniae]HDS7828815.1 hypothetical protein [Klebsiella variicola]HDZ2826881.1 hypothetical protein [Klebsiella pneumoniae]